MDANEYYVAVTADAAPSDESELYDAMIQRQLAAHGKTLVGGPRESPFGYTRKSSGP